MSLSGRLVEDLEAALLDAFRDDDALDALLKRVEMQAKVPSRAPLEARVGKLVEVVDSHGGMRDLLDAARGLVPGNAALAQIQRVIAAEPNGAPAGKRQAHGVVAPHPTDLDLDVQARAQRLREAQVRQTTLRNAGLPTDEVDREVLQRRRELREGGQLHAGDDVGGRYLLIEKIGRGGFAVVWKAYDTIEKRDVAVKVLHSNLAGDLLRRERFFRGAKAMVNLAHPAVVRVLDPRGEDAGFCYFVMELMTGGNLREAVLENRIETTNVLSLVMQVGEALARAHASGVVHRDVKPSNIVLDENGNARLTDFDLVGAHDTTGGTRTGALGTVVYAAPECLDRPQDATARADVYGLGMTAIFCLLGQDLTLATFRNPVATIERLDCSAGVRKVLECAVAWEADRRFEHAAAMLSALRGALEADRAAQDARVSFGAIALHRLLLRLANDQETAMVVVRNERSVGRIYLRNGAVYCAMIDEDLALNPKKAIYRLLSWTTGEIEVVRGIETHVGKLLREPLAELLAEGLRQGEVWRTLETRLPGPYVRLHVPTPLAGKLRELTALELDTFQLVLEHHLLQKVLDGFPGTDLEAGTHVASLMRRDFLVGPAEWKFTSRARRELPESTTMLAIDRLQELPEFRRLREQLPSLSASLTIPTPLTRQLSGLAREQLDTFQAVLDHGQVRKVLGASPDTALDMARNLVHLMQIRLVVVR